MWRGAITRTAFCTGALVLSLLGGARADEAVPLTVSLGPQIDAGEREAYSLFPGVAGFAKARVVRRDDGQLRLEITTIEAKGRDDAGRPAERERTRTRKLSQEAFDLARAHAEMVEAARAEGSLDPSADEAAFMRRLATRYAAQRRYDLATALADDLARGGGTQAAWARDFSARIQGFDTRLGVPFLRPGAMDRSGRNDLLVFAAYYGVWLGIATPIALDIEDAKSIAPFVMILPVTTIVTANLWARDRDITRGRASVIALGGNWGTWQGAALSAIGDAESDRGVAYAEASGLVGLGLAAWLTSRIDFHEGRAELMNAGMLWGGWLGFVTTRVADLEGDELVAGALVGSDALMVAAAIGAKDVRMSRTRGRLISLGGVAGTLFGFGVDLIAEVDDTRGALAVAGAGSVAGLVLATLATRNIDDGRDYSMSEPTGEPRFRLAATALRSAAAGGAPQPAFGIALDF
jgi:hypothetical protein